jgi:predicted ATPase
MSNPYASALDGLTLDDPVAAFFAFCREREAVRMRRESGAPPPWTEDAILQRGRFLNVFREDDRGSRAIRRFVEPVRDDLERLVHALFFARWCNRQSTLDRLSAHDLTDPIRLRRTLETDVPPPWFNPTAYPVGPVSWQGERVSRIDAAVGLFGRISGFLSQSIQDADRSVVRATDAINAAFEMDNPFPIFMAVVDVADLRPDVIDPASHVPTGIGAVAFLDRLQAHLGLDNHHETAERMIELQAERWPDAKRALQPIDVEYLSCECRKYYSYVCGTKAFTGKNAFAPGRPAMISFDVPAAAVPDSVVPTAIQVVAGGPCSGKTTLLRALADAGHDVRYETSERLLREGIEGGASAAELRGDPTRWQQEILGQDFALFDGLQTDQTVFTDTSFIEDRVFAARAGVEFGPTTTAWLRRRRYGNVYFLEPLESYEQTEVRMESQAAAAAIGAQVLAAYEEFGYEPIRVPMGSVEQRIGFILSHLAEEPAGETTARLPGIGDRPPI